MSYDDDAAPSGAPLSFRNRHVQRLRQLLRDAAARRAANAYVVEGVRLVAEVADAGNEGDEAELFVDLGRPAAAALAARWSGPVHVVDPAALDRALDVASSQGVAAIVGRPPAPDPASFDVANGVLWAVGVSDPGNLGTMLRAALAVGIGGVVCTATTDPFGPKVVRAGGGAHLRLPIAVEDDVTNAADALDGAGFRLIGAAADGDATYWDADLVDAAALVVGSEAHGIPDAVRARLTSVVSIPMPGATESLNAGVAAALVLYERLRQVRAR